MIKNQTLKSKEKFIQRHMTQNQTLKSKEKVYPTTHDQQSNLEVEGKSVSNDT